MDRKVREILELAIRLETVEFIGLCRVLSVELVRPIENVEEEAEIKSEARDFTEIWKDVTEKVNGLNRAQKKNLLRLLRAAVKDKK